MIEVYSQDIARYANDNKQSHIPRASIIVYIVFNCCYIFVFSE